MIDKAEDLQKVTEGFGVFGNYSTTAGTTPTYGDNLFKNEQVTYSNSNTTSTKWAYKNTKYWPTEGHIDFLAYAPFDNSKTLSGTKIDFTVNPTFTEQKDLLWANAANRTMKDNPVKFTFNHALSRLGYSVKLKDAYSDATITLKTITLAGSDDATKTAFYTEGTIDLSKETKAADLWKIPTPANKQNFEWFSGEKQLSKTDATENSNKGYLFVIPQDFSQTTGADELYVIVEYTISYSGVTTIMKSKVCKKLDRKFLQGKAYTINLTIGLTPIEFNADVTEWEIPTDGAIDINTWE